MSWASLASNEAVSFNNLQNAVNTGVFTAKTTIPATNECITKTDADTYVNINISIPSYAAKTSNQLVVKNDLSAGSTPSIYITISSGFYPVTGPSNTTTGYIFNNTSSSIYLTLVFNSGGQSSGYIPTNTDTLNVYLDPTIRVVSVYGTITGSGTTLTSETNSPTILAIIPVAANESRYFFIDKLDGYGSGSTLRIYYSNDISGPYSPITKI